jgi:hypothetical protein
LSTIINSFITITCDGPCLKTITFPQTQEGEQEALQANPWLNTLRFVQTSDNRKFSYCSDECEAKGLGTGQHNKLEPKKIVQAGGQQAVEMAAQAAARSRQATEALRQGSPVELS